MASFGKKLFKTFKDLTFEITVGVNKNNPIFGCRIQSLYWYCFTIFVAKYLKYVNTKSNLRISVIKHISRRVECRISRNSSTKEIIQCKKIDSGMALRKGGGHNIVLAFSPYARPKYSAKTIDVICFNPRFNLQLNTKIGRLFLGFG